MGCLQCLSIQEKLNISPGHNRPIQLYGNKNPNGEHKSLKELCLLKGNCFLYTDTLYIIMHTNFFPFYFHLIYFRTKLNFITNLSYPVLSVHPCLSSQSVLPKGTPLPWDLLMWQTGSALQQDRPDNEPHSGWLVRGYQLVKGMVTVTSFNFPG